MVLAECFLGSFAMNYLFRPFDTNINKLDELGINYSLNKPG